VVGDGREAVEAVVRGSYAAVLMDCRLPGIDGCQAAAEIRRREGAARHTPIIALTAGDQPRDRARCLAAGMDDYLVKPVMVADLQAALSRWLAGPAPAAPPPAGGDPGSELLAVFRDTAPADLARLKVAVAAGDPAGVERAAHHLAGAALTVGRERAARLCRELGLLTGAGELRAAMVVLAELEEELER
jgi:two-component system sensor histidine kinase/response regulator